MTTARGDVRSAVEFEGAGASAAGIKAIEDNLRGIATTSQATELRLRGMAAAGDRSANALQNIGRSFTPLGFEGTEPANLPAAVRAAVAKRNEVN